MSDHIQPPTSIPKSWSAGMNLRPKGERDEAGEGQYQVRMTFDDTAAAEAWLRWLMSIDPAWGGKTP